MDADSASDKNQRLIFGTWTTSRTPALSLDFLPYLEYMLVKQSTQKDLDSGSRSVLQEPHLEYTTVQKNTQKDPDLV